MKHLRLVLAGLVTGSVVIGVACTFPDVSFDDGASPDTEAGVAPDVDVPDVEVPEDSGDDRPDVSLPPDVDPDGEDAGTVTLDDASLTPVDSGCGSCDCDEDGYDRLELPMCDGGGVKPGVDCDDTIKAIHPGQTDFVADTWPNASIHPIVGDWDCDNKVIKQYNYKVNCGLLCAGSKGFSDDPQCGGRGNYVECTGLPPLLCGSKAVDNRKQGCH